MFKLGRLEGYEIAKPPTFKDGVILLILNPKAYVVIALMYTQFLDQSQSGWPTTMFLIAAVFTLNNLIAFSLWAVVGRTIIRYFTTPESAQILNTVFGAVLAAVAVWIFLS